jgi:S-formylglutathione hydrolase FrmB
MVRDMIVRGTVVGAVDAAQGVSFTVHPPRGRVVLTATVDVGQLGLAAVTGEGDDTLSGMSAPFEAADGATAPPIALASHSGRKRPERCQGPQLTLERIDAPEVAGTVGNPTSRRACVRVPPGYADHPDRHYPVIYVVPGLGSNDESVIAGYKVEPADAIVVAVDTSTRTGSTYLVDSPTSGHWDTFFTRDLVPFIDAHYRTLPRPSARAVMGQSTGGFNAVSYGLRHPELIGVIGASAPDALDLEVWLRDGGKVRPWIQGLQRIERGLGGGGQLVSYAADWSPTARGYDWPFDASGAVIDRVLQRWLAHNPATWLRDPKRVAALLPFSGHIYLSVGETDEFDLLPPTVAFSKALTAVGIENQLVVNAGGHGGPAQRQRLAAIAEFCVAKLEAAR